MMVWPSSSVVFTFMALSLLANHRWGPRLLTTSAKQSHPLAFAFTTGELAALPLPSPPCLLCLKVKFHCFMSSCQAFKLQGAA